MSRLTACLAVVVGCAALATPCSAATLLGLIDTGELYASTDDGVTWTLRGALPVHDAVALEARFAATDLFLASRSGGVYRSPDGGTTWAAVGAIPASDVADLLVRLDGAVLILTTGGSIYRSADQGASFGGIAAITGSGLVGLTQRSDGAVYALARTGEVYESADQGASWTPRSAITVANAVRIRALGQTLYVLTETGEVAKSTDAAASWTVVGTLSQVGMRGLVKNGTSLVAASREGHVAASADGSAWTWRGSIDQLTLTALATDAPVATGVDEPPSATSLSLAAPYPNPSRDGSATLTIHLERGTEVTLELHDLAGRLVDRRGPETLPAGTHRLKWSPGPARSGLYWVRLRGASGEAAERKWVLLER